MVRVDLRGLIPICPYFSKQLVKTINVHVTELCKSEGKR
jgi:hypothetical protein